MMILEQKIFHLSNIWQVLDYLQHLYRASITHGHADACPRKIF